jgi:hypothetical protein
MVTSRSYIDKKYPTLSMDQMIELFNDGNISKNNCKIDRNKLFLRSGNRKEEM